MPSATAGVAASATKRRRSAITGRGRAGQAGELPVGEPRAQLHLGRGQAAVDEHGAARRRFSSTISAVCEARMPIARCAARSSVRCTTSRMSTGTSYRPWSLNASSNDPSPLDKRTLIVSADATRLLLPAPGRYPTPRYSFAPRGEARAFNPGLIAYRPSLRERSLDLVSRRTPRCAGLAVAAITVTLRRVGVGAGGFRLWSRRGSPAISRTPRTPNRFCECACARCLSWVSHGALETSVAPVSRFERRL